MKKLDNKWLLIAILVLAGLFYWFQIRPSSIRSACAEESVSDAINILCSRAEHKTAEFEKFEKARLLESCNAGLYFPDDYDEFYIKCLNEKGLE